MSDYLPFPDKKYKIIYADPPWAYSDKLLFSKQGASSNYSVQSKEWIDNLPVSTIADDDCALFLWVTMPKLNECWELISKWGFTYKTVAFTWIKKNKSGKGIFLGLGRWTRGNAEVCLLAVKGKPKRIDASVRQVVMTRLEYHSKKPDIVRNRIVKLMGNLPRIELFARRSAPGWDAWGNEVDKEAPMPFNCESNACKTCDCFDCIMRQDDAQQTFCPALVSCLKCRSVESQSQKLCCPYKQKMYDGVNRIASSGRIVTV
jgi:N6-adenosine-specific RNA methylase IME4